MNKILTAFSKYPRDGHSLRDAAVKFRSKHFIEMRGNVFERLTGTLDDSTRATYLKASSAAALAHKKFNGDITCILRELKKL